VVWYGYFLESPIKNDGSNKVEKLKEEEKGVDDSTYETEKEPESDDDGLPIA